jgi:hypothetical protein
VVTSAAYTVAQAINDWLADGLRAGRPRPSAPSGKCWSRSSASSGRCRCVSSPRLPSGLH